jgi:predicted Zn-ribbon and HTH transcriptional regulator
VYTDRYLDVLLAWWFLFACFATLATLLNRAWRKRRYQRPGLCRTCGYDLRATPHRCPECGAIPQPPNAPDRAKAGLCPKCYYQVRPDRDHCPMCKTRYEMVQCAARARYVTNPRL